MLQGLNLPFIEIASLENELNYSVSLPGQGIEPARAFADIFKLEPEGLTDLQPGVGTPLPLTGNVLPLHLNDVPVEASIDDFEPGLPQPDVQATNPLPIATLMPANAPIQVLLIACHTGVSESTPVVASLPNPGPTQPANPELSGTVIPAAEGRANAQDLPERVNLVVPRQGEPLRPAPLAQVPAPPVAAELPVLPVSSEAVANVLDQAAPVKKTVVNLTELRPVVETGSPPKPLPEVAAVESLQGSKPVSSVPVVPQPTPMTPLAGNSGETPMGQQIQFSPMSFTQVANRIGGDASVTTPPTLSLIDTPVSEPAWGDRIGDRLLIMASNKTQSAEIRLTPAELGPLRVRIAVDDGVASVTFNAQHAVTREAIDQAMPRLRELFAENGLTLQQSDIAESDGHDVQQGKQDQGDDRATAGMPGADSENESLADNSTTELTLQPRSDKLVDTFA